MSSTETPKAQNSVVASLLRARESSVAAVLVLLGIFLFLSPARDTFYSQRNWQNLLLQISLLSIFAIGETIVIITGGIDLSLGSLIAFSGMLLAASANAFDARMYTGIAILLAIMAALLASLAIGALHATLIHRLKLPAFVVTLAALTFFRSQSLLMNSQLPISVSHYPFLTWLAGGKFFENSPLPIPVPLVILAIVAITVHLILSRTRTGRYVYSLGSNEQATRLSGINVGRVKLFAYGTSALLGGLAGILFAGYGGEGDPLSGAGYELNAVAAAVIGGANLNGGQGSVAGTVLGACLLRVILSGINLTIQKNSSLWEGTIIGAVLLLAVLTSALQQRKGQS
ncbi:MAG: ABC transporter permease [Armatimonadetes bacterium]|nr:ABC transporter permease [Armatimonadota bacterium]